MYHKIFRNAALAALFSAGIATAFADNSREVDYGKPVTLAGTITAEYDMSFVDSDLSPLKDPKAVARAVADAERKHPHGKSKLKRPVRHFILRLDQPLVIREGTDDGLHPEMHNVREIDLGTPAMGRYRIPDEALGKVRFTVTGRLWHASTVHHLRPIMMDVTQLRPVAE